MEKPEIHSFFTRFSGAPPISAWIKASPDSRTGVQIPPAPPLMTTPANGRPLAGVVFSGPGGSRFGRRFAPFSHVERGKFARGRGASRPALSSLYAAPRFDDRVRRRGIGSRMPVLVAISCSSMVRCTPAVLRLLTGPRPGGQRTVARACNRIERPRNRGCHAFDRSMLGVEPAFSVAWVPWLQPVLPSLRQVRWHRRDSGVGRRLGSGTSVHPSSPLAP